MDTREQASNGSTIIPCLRYRDALEAFVGAADVGRCVQARA